MKKKYFSGFAVLVWLLAACNNRPATETMAGGDINKNKVGNAMATADKEITTIAVLYPVVDAKASASINKIVDQYLRVKNALASDQAGEAANGANAMQDDFRKLDKSLLTSEQKKLYDPIEESLEEHAAHIAKNGDKIKHQREHFAMMSEDAYDLVKAFGGGRELYHDHCPMYNENKGAMWLSEVKEVKNPYFGVQMPDCGTVEEVIK